MRITVDYVDCFDVSRDRLGHHLSVLDLLLQSSEILLLLIQLTVILLFVIFMLRVHRNLLFHILDALLQLIDLETSQH